MAKKLDLREGEKILNMSKVYQWELGNFNIKFLGKYYRIHGILYITNQRIKFINTDIIYKNRENFDIELKDLDVYQKCRAPIFPYMPFGILFKTTDGKEFILTLGKRDKVINLLNELLG